MSFVAFVNFLVISGHSHRMAFPKIPKVVLGLGTALFPTIFILFPYCFAPGAVAAHFSNQPARFPRTGVVRGHNLPVLLQLR